MNLIFYTYESMKNGKRMKMGFVLQGMKKVWATGFIKPFVFHLAICDLPIRHGSTPTKLIQDPFVHTKRTGIYECSFHPKWYEKYTPRAQNG